VKGRDGRGDTNVAVAGLLLDMAALQRSKQSSFGYKRAASAIFSLDRRLDTYLERGALREIHGVGPAVERIVLEHAAGGISPTVETLLAQAPASQREDVLERRQVREGFLSWASVLDALAAPRPAEVVSPSSYRGDLQMHTTWSDGADGVETMAEGARAKGWSRICVTDHSYGLPIARGMSMERVGRQHQEIDAVNERFDGRMRVLKGIEANILADGRVDMEPEELARFELVVAAPHSLLRKPYDQTERLLAAVRTAGVHILGHPRGRVFNKRAGVVARWDRVFAEAARRGVAIELDGTWDRQDLDYELAQAALDAGCIFAVDSDAHSVHELEYTAYGLAHARLASIPADRVINCWDDQKLFDWARLRRGSNMSPSSPHRDGGPGAPARERRGVGPRVTEPSVLGSPALVRCAHPRLQYPRWQRVPQPLPDRLGCADDLVEIHAGLGAEPVEHVHQVLGREVPGRAGGVRAAAQPAGRGVEGPDPEIERGQHVGERGTARVVQMQCDLPGGYLGGEAGEQRSYLPRMGDADRVADRHFERPHIEKADRERRDATGIDDALERASERGREVRPHAHSPLARRAAHAGVPRQRLFGPLVEVPPAEALGRRGEDRDFRHAGCDRALEPGKVGHEGRVPYSGSALDPGEHLGGIGHLRHPPRADEG
jgi:histidinol phosphatase-like PHP family hydrolase